MHGQLGSREQSRCDEEWRGGGEVSRDLDVAELQPLDRPDRDTARAAAHRHAGLREQRLRVVAGRRLLGDRGLAAVCVETREEHRGLHLRARDGQLVFDWPERSTLDRDRRATVCRLDRGSHQAQRLCDPLHRPGAERVVAGQLEPSFLTCEQPGQQAHERACVAAVDRLLGRLQAAQAGAEDAERAVVDFVDAHAERADGRERRLGVPRTAEARDARLPVRHRPEQQRSVRERLVAGDADVPPHGRRRLDLHAHVPVEKELRKSCNRDTSAWDTSGDSPRTGPGETRRERAVVTSPPRARGRRRRRSPVAPGAPRRARPPARRRRGSRACRRARSRGAAGRSRRC